ncbi:MULTISPECIES: LysR family transcriptional regulator [unclassified Moraxella]|uniref:LysR family transcriptional regulator n=1 Tax=unclassified Moraxella TaxID=2685852 RepID=UPI002B407C60|nr:MULTISPECIES: LysR family transcriptional regulator [unclassified Moraxella]
MDLSHLNTFIHVARTGNISQSAKMLGVPQPTLSRHITQLEHTLGQKLIDRQHRPIKLTPAGNFFYQHAKKNLHELTELITLTKNFGKSTPNTLNIGFVASILYGLLPDVISELRTRLPHLDIRLIEVSSDEQTHALKTGEIDVGFGRFLSSQAFIQQLFLRHEQLVVALPTQHQLAKNHSMTFEALSNEMLILYHRTPMLLSTGQTFDPLLHLFYERHLTPKHTQKVRDIQVALGLVSAGEGITIVPMSLKGIHQDKITYLPFSPNDITSSIYLNTLSGDQNPNILALLKSIHTIYEQKNITQTNPLLQNL